ncbi:MAG: hypothetical protein HOP28_08335 [Gemmatimonadales bacterium]|nr:hypothetical protein [Gemmatimonadales bacterium]
MIIHRVKPQVSAMIDQEVWNGQRQLDLSPYLVEVPDAGEVDIDLLKGLLKDALDRHLDKETELDQWLAPRFHSALRIAPRLAGDAGVWTWLCFQVGLPYLRHRWPFNLYRLTGDFKRNGLSRLWFFSEMARNGADYADVRLVLRNPSTAQYAMENRYAMYRPAVIAFGRLAEQRQSSFDEMKQLSKRINAYLSLRSLEASGYMTPDEGIDVDWWNDRPTLAEVVGKDPKGPRDHEVPDKAIRELMVWYESLLPEADDEEAV